MRGYPSSKHVCSTARLTARPHALRPCARQPRGCHYKFVRCAAGRVSVGQKSHRTHASRHVAQMASAACRAGRAARRALRPACKVQAHRRSKVLTGPVRPRVTTAQDGRSAAGRVSVGQGTRRAHAWVVRWVVRSVSLNHRQARGPFCRASSAPQAVMCPLIDHLDGRVICVKHFLYCGRVAEMCGNRIKKPIFVPKLKKFKKFTRIHGKKQK